MLENNTRQKSIRQFMITLFVLCFGLFITYYATEVRRYNTTILAFNYTHGFISRGLLGTLFLLADKVLPYELLTYENIVNFTLISTTIVMLTFFLLVYLILKRCESVYLSDVQYIVIFFSMFFVSMYYSLRNFGRPDIYMLFLVFLGTLSLVIKRCEWIIIPLSILNVMIHQGYVFLFYNVFMYLLAYRAYKTTGKTRIKYLSILGISFLAVSAFFLYFNFFSHINDIETYNDIYAFASAIGKDGDVYVTLLDHEILGIDPWNEEWPQHIYNFIELPLFCLLTLPYLILGVRLFKNIIKAAESKMDKFMYAMIPIASLTMLPCYLLKIDFGRWIFASLTYFCLVVLVLCSYKDKIVTEKLHELMVDIQSRYSYSYLLLVYISTVVPLYDIHINQSLRSISNYLDTYWLHILPPLPM